jgi:hypothetical protein
MKKFVFRQGVMLMAGLALATAAHAADKGGQDILAGGSNLLLASAADSMGTVRNEDRMLEGSKYTREASCIPSGGVSRSQIVLATMSYLKQHPQDRGLPTGALLRQALRQAYPCPE